MAPPQPTPGAPPLPRALIAAALALALDALLLALGLGGWEALRANRAALALLGTWGAAGLALAVLRPVRPAAVRERRPDAWVMLALLVLPLVTPAVGAWGARRHLAALPQAVPWDVIGPALVAAGLALRIAAMARLGTRFSPLVAVQEGHVLETGGLYSRLRHPGYLGSLLAGVGGAVAFGSAAALPLVLGMFAAARVRIRHEERLLAATFGEAWSRYASRTGALWPRLGARSSS